MTHFYRIKRWGSPRFGDECKIVAGPARNGTIAIRFADGYLMFTVRWGVRKLKR